MEIITSNVIREFYRNFLVGKEDECWNWFGTKDKGEYSRFGVNYKKYSGHVVSYCIANNLIRILEGCVLHDCDNPSCVNPKHLSYGTQQDNISDMVTKGRQAKGVEHGESKLIDKEVIEIRKRYKTEGISQTELAKQYNISQMTIQRIIHNKLWKHLV